MNDKLLLCCVVLCSALLPFVISRSSKRPSLSLILPLLVLLCHYRLTSSLITALPFWHRELTWDVGLECVCISAFVCAHVCKSHLFKYTVGVFAPDSPIVLKIHHEFNWWALFSLVCWRISCWNRKCGWDMEKTQWISITFWYNNKLWETALRTKAAHF